MKIDLRRLLNHDGSWTHGSMLQIAKHASLIQILQDCIVMSGLVTSASTAYSGHLRSSSWDRNWSKHFGPNAPSERTTKICKTHLFWFSWVPNLWINNQLQKHSAFQNHKSAAQKDQPQRGHAVGLVPANKCPGTCQDKALWLFETVSINRQWVHVEYTIRTDQMQMPISSKHSWWCHFASSLTSLGLVVKCPSLRALLRENQFASCILEWSSCDFGHLHCHSPVREILITLTFSLYFR